MSEKRKRGRPRKNAKAPEVFAEIKPKRQYIQNIVVQDKGVKCPHCPTTHGHTKREKYPNGNQRMICGGCGKPFVGRKAVIQAINVNGYETPVAESKEATFIYKKN